MMRKIAVASMALLLTVFLAAPAFAHAPPSSSFTLNGVYDNDFVWFGFNLFGTNVAYGAWSNCPVPSGNPPTSNPRCLVKTANGNDAFANSGWDNNVPSSSYFSETWPEICTITNPTVMRCTVNTAMVGPFSGSVTFHREGATNNWFANPQNPANTIKLLTSTGSSEYGFVVYGGVLQFGGYTPSANNFLGGKIASWGYNFPAYVSSSSFPNAVYVPSEHAYLAITESYYISSSPLHNSAIISLIGTAPYLPLVPTPAGFT